MLVYIVLDGDSDFQTGSVTEVFDNLQSALAYTAELEAELNGDYSYEHYLEAVTAMYQTNYNATVGVKHDYCPFYFIIEKEVRG